MAGYSVIAHFLCFKSVGCFFSYYSCTMCLSQDRLGWRDSLKDVFPHGVKGFKKNLCPSVEILMAKYVCTPSDMYVTVLC